MARDINGQPAIRRDTTASTCDINGQPASRYDGSHISKGIRSQLGKLSDDKAVRIRAVADRPKIVRPATFDEHLEVIGTIREINGR